VCASSSKDRARRFPPPWSIEETAARLIERDSGGYALTRLYFKGKARPT
jgi:hypothetical protein